MTRSRHPQGAGRGAVLSLGENGARPNHGCCRVTRRNRYLEYGPVKRSPVPPLGVHVLGRQPMGHSHADAFQICLLPRPQAREHHGLLRGSSGIQLRSLRRVQELAHVADGVWLRKGFDIDAHRSGGEPDQDQLAARRKGEVHGSWRSGHRRPPVRPPAAGARLTHVRDILGGEPEITAQHLAKGHVSEHVTDPVTGPRQRGGTSGLVGIQVR